MSERDDVLTLIADWERASAPMPMVDILRLAADEIARLREERRWIEGRVTITRETFDKVVSALDRSQYVAGDDGDEYNDDGVIDALDSIKRDAAQPLPPGPEGDA